MVIFHSYVKLPEGIFRPQPSLAAPFFGPSASQKKSVGNSESSAAQREFSAAPRPGTWIAWRAVESCLRWCASMPRAKVLMEPCAFGLKNGLWGLGGLYLEKLHSYQTNGLQLYSWCLSSRILQEEPNHTKPVSRMGFCGNLYQISIAQLKLYRIGIEDPWN